MNTLSDNLHAPFHEPARTSRQAIHARKIVEVTIETEDLLQGLGVGDHPVVFGDGPLELAASIHRVKMLVSNKVHRDIRVDENHSFASPYPRSISATI